MKGWRPDFLCLANEPSIWPKIQLIMKFPLDCSQNRNPDHEAIFVSAVLFLFLEMICLCWGAGEFFAGEILCVHLLVISSFSSVFPLLRITMATGSRRSRVSYKRMNNTNVNVFLHIHTFGNIKQNLPSQ